jgi:hypothetical protein
MNIIKTLDLYKKNVLDTGCSPYGKKLYFDYLQIINNDFKQYDVKNITEQDILEILDNEPVEQLSNLEYLAILMDEYHRSYHALHKNNDTTLYQLLDQFHEHLFDQLYKFNFLFEIDKIISDLKNAMGKIKIRELNCDDLYKLRLRVSGKEWKGYSHDYPRYLEVLKKAHLSYGFSLSFTFC